MRKVFLYQSTFSHIPLQDLFGMVGQVEKARITFDRSGRSTGTAHVRFARQSDAEKALDKYNNVELDGKSFIVYDKNK